MTEVFDNPGPGIAWVSGRQSGFRIAIRSPQTSVDYDRQTIGDTAEFAILLREEGNWKLRFRPSAEVVRILVDELDEADL